MDLDIYVERISRYLKVKHIKEYKSRRVWVYTNRNFFGRIKKSILSKLKTVDSNYFHFPFSFLFSFWFIFLYSIFRTRVRVKVMRSHISHITWHSHKLQDVWKEVEGSRGIILYNVHNCYKMRKCGQTLVRYL